MTAVFGSIHLTVRESEPKVGVVFEHLPGEGSVHLTNHPMNVYLIGTRSEIVDWARRVIAAAHELPKSEEVSGD